MSNHNNDHNDNHNHGHSLLGGLIQIHEENLHLNELLSQHDHGHGHGPALIIGPLSFFQTDGLGEVVHDIVHDLFHDHHG